MLARPVNPIDGHGAVPDIRESHLKRVEFHYPPDEESIFPGRLARPNRFFKRGLDVLGSLVGLVGMGLSLPYIAWRIRKESPGPIFYRQPRTGLDGEEFLCWKFRSMRVNADVSADGGPIITQVGDSRIFPFGQWMRNTNVDELPQLINVLMGWDPLESTCRHASLSIL